METVVYYSTSDNLDKSEANNDGAIIAGQVWNLLMNIKISDKFSLPLCHFSKSKYFQFGVDG